ncbi:bacteriohemerythrin [Magnetospirillum gryphiswaldense]|nr:bacteriohemerythrin [Magnetospirillum gryphiswaldense]AVM72841.1 Bacteriohemerythrin [Magnetospirillum gryphiswaldense MSR-1]AVM76744.1 Bacteriohemerythrin [Magnetospirillum gryphiswaldense]CAJ30107.1 hemerythrin-like protein [Magnetospirillum gryphiswaldense MSR-1]CAM78014.1 Hemerythrin-like protein [Magnetospirillum gryphiswaldense MSR-1]
MARPPLRGPIDVLVAVAMPAVCRLLVGLIREMGINEVTVVDSVDFATLKLRHASITFNLILCDRLGGAGHLDLLKLVRWGRHGLAPSIPVICVGEEWTGDELLANRDAGATATLALPLTKHTLKVAVETAIAERREFVDTPTFRGIDRRHSRIKGYKGPFRRATDANRAKAHGSQVGQGNVGPTEPQEISAYDEELSVPVKPDFGWSKAIETGRNDIDSQHRGIIDIMNDLNEVPDTEDGDGTKVERALIALKDYVKIHFSHEEQLMDSFDYDDRKRHKKLHSAFVAKIETLKAGSLTSPDVRRKLLGIVYNWLMSHITCVDRIMIAQLNGEQGSSGIDPNEKQTTIVIDDALMIVRDIQKLTVKLSGMDDGPRKVALCRRIAEETERLINLMGLACDRIEMSGCSTFHIRRLGDIRAAVNFNADCMAQDAARSLIRYGKRIMSGSHGVPLGVGAVLSRMKERVQLLIHVIGGHDAMSLAAKAAVTEAMDIADAVHALESKMSAGLTEIHLLATANCYDQTGRD